ncbi:MAG: AbiV family abortive infection protein [Desulfobaccales bacterium]
MSERKLNHYKGELSAAQIAEGMNAAARNARRLAEEAELLIENKRYATATSLAILSIEESGKESILRGLSVARNDKELKEAWKDYRSHTKKNVAWVLMDMVKAGARKLDDFLPMFKEDAEHPYILDNLKQIGFYTDCLGNAHWSIPEEVIDEGIAKMVIYLAKIFISKKEITEKEIELWIKHLGPVWKKDMRWMQQALENWYHEMQECGLSPEGPNKMRNFIKKGIKITTDTL